LLLLPYGPLLIALLFLPAFLPQTLNTFFGLPIQSAHRIAFRPVLGPLNYIPHLLCLVVVLFRARRRNLPPAHAHEAVFTASPTTVC